MQQLHVFNDIVSYHSDMPNDRLCFSMRRNHLMAAAGLCLALIAYATLARLVGRPVIVGHAETYWAIIIERFSIYGLLGFLLSFMLPGRIAAACSLVIVVAIGLELAQTLISDHAFASIDVLQKTAGGIVGVFLAQTILTFLPRPPT
ncbi:hypothetical protein QWJ07_32040 [Frankia sp. RB7]|nr:hypothetical protein [Frankia sp. RB7]